MWVTLNIKLDFFARVTLALSHVYCSTFMIRYIRVIPKQRNIFRKWPKFEFIAIFKSIFTFIFLLNMKSRQQVQIFLAIPWIAESFPETQDPMTILGLWDCPGNLESPWTFGLFQKPWTVPILMVLTLGVAPPKNCPFALEWHHSQSNAPKKDTNMVIFVHH